MPQGDRPSSPLVSADAQLPYSKGLMARTLMGAGLSPVRAYYLARRIEDRLGDKADRVGADELHDVTVAILDEEGAPEVLEHLTLLEKFYQLDIPLIVLVGGTTGTGKSTISAEVAHRLGVTRLTGTDVVRETMRAFFPKTVMPTIHYSTFNAADGLHLPDYEPTDSVLLGYLEQTRHVRVGVQAVIARAVEEGYSQVIEGVHLVPGDYAAEVAEPSQGEGALLVQFLIAVHDEDEHARRFKVRDFSSHGKRPLSKYVKNLPEIRRIQDYLITRAEKSGVPVLDAANSETAVQSIMRTVLLEVAALTKEVVPELAEETTWLQSVWRTLLRFR